jgi:undecaprenyl-diphosphatase
LLLASVGVSTLALLLLTKVGEDVFEHESDSFDDGVRTWMLGQRTPSLFTVFTWISAAGAVWPMLVFTAAVVIWLWRSARRRAAASAIAAPASAVALSSLIKLAFARSRPPGALHFALRSFAFPSGHATISTTVAATIAYILWRERLLNGRVTVVLGVLIPLLVGVSRIYLDVHWATDVIGGWCLGLLISAVAATVYEWLHHRLPDR